MTVIKRDQSYTAKSIIKFVEHLQEQLKSKDVKIAAQAQSDLKEVLLTQAKLRDREASRRLKRDLGITRKATAEDEAEITALLGKTTSVEETDFFA